MLWSAIKIVLFVAGVGALAYGAGVLMEAEGGVRIVVMNTEYTLGPLQIVIGVLVLLLVVWLVLKLLGLLVAIVRFLTGDETAISRYFNRARERRGFEALADGLMALASGEGKLAMSKAARAERYLKRPELTNLITAQAAEMTGDRRKAEEVYKRLLQDDRTRFVGVRGLMKQKLEEGETDVALKLAEKAFALKPQHEETQDVLLRLQAEVADWAGARKTLAAKLRHGALPRDVHRRRDAVLAVAEASTSDTPRPDVAIEANRLSPELVPAAVLAAREYIAEGKKRYAVRVLKKAWEAEPHPDLAATFALIEPDETPQERIRRFATLTRIHPDHPETRMLLAELHIANGDFAAARKALGDLVEKDPTARALTLMAAIEKGEGAEDSVVRGWLARALTAPRGPQWVCDNCQSVASEWSAVCPNCGAFDTLFWRTPSGDTARMPGSTEMLPLIVGAPDEADAAEESAGEDAGADAKEEAAADTPGQEPANEADPRSDGADTGEEPPDRIEDSRLEILVAGAPRMGGN